MRVGRQLKDPKFDFKKSDEYKDTDLADDW